MSHTSPVSGGRLARRSLVNACAATAALALALGSAPRLAATVIDFGGVPLDNSYAGPGGGSYTDDLVYASGGASFNNNNAGYWDGFAYSTTSDTTTAGFGNQYSAYSTGNSGTYAVAYPGYLTPTTISFATDVAPVSVDLANTTYAYLSMLNGDGIAKKFETGTGAAGDWFSVTLTGYDAAHVSTGAVTFYLANFQFENNSLDYILADWTTVDLTGLGGGVRSIELSWDSSDTSVFGGETYVNTPTYVAIDNLNFTAVPEPSSAVALAGFGALALGLSRRRRAVRAA